MNHIHRGTGCGAWQTHRAPPEIRRRVPRLRDVRHIRGHRVAFTTQRHQFKRRIGRLQGRHKG